MLMRVSRKSKFLSLIITTALVSSLFQPVLSVKAISTLDFTGPVLKTNTGGIYSESNWDLDMASYNFTRPADNPTPPGDVFNPTFGATVQANIPVISTYTQQADKDTSFVLQGMDFTVNTGSDACKDTKVWLYRQTTSSNGELSSLPLLNENINTITATINNSSVPYSMYLAWVENANGRSYPVRINAPDVWWIGPNHATAGSSVSVYGRNLSKNDGRETSYVYLRPWGADAGTPSTAATVTTINAYKVTFTVPSGLTAGDYEVWIHNGHGGEYGWGGPQKLTIESTSSYQWNGTTRDVTAYGADPTDPNNDDSAAIQAAINAAANGDKIYFPAGIYKIVASRINVNKSLSIEGASNDATIIYVDSNYTPDDVFHVTKWPSKFSKLTIKDEHTLTGGPKLINLNAWNVNPPPKGAIIEYCNFVQGEHNVNSNYAIAAAWINDVYIRQNTFTAYAGIIMDNIMGAYINNNTFNGNWLVGNYNGAAMILPKSCSKADISSNTAMSIDRTGDMAAGQKTVAKFCHNVSPYGNLTRTYVADNTVTRAGNFISNTGEQVLFETSQPYYSGSPSAISDTTMTFTGTTWDPNMNFAEDNADLFETGKKSSAVVTIQKGTGTGQYRRIISNTTNTITIDRPWNIQPDTGSVVTISAATIAVAVFNNTIDGIPNYYQNENGTAGTELYGAAFDTVISNNTISNVHYGIYMAGLSRETVLAGSVAPNIGVLVSNNYISNACYGVAVYENVPCASTADYSGVLSMNNVIRGNSITNIRTGSTNTTMGGFGLIVGALYRYWTDGYKWDGPWVQNNVLEKNTVTDAAKAYAYFRKHQENTVLRKNTFTDSDTYTGTTGIKFDPLSDKEYICNNSYSINIDTKYGVNDPGSSLQVDKKSLDFSAEVGGSNPENQTVTVYNAGTSTLTISVSADASWLSGSLSSGTISTENDSSIMTVNVDKAGLAEGTYYGTLTITGGTNYSPQTIGVKLTVTN